MARPPKPIALRKLEGKHPQSKIPKEIDVLSTCPEPPSHINGYALEEWNRLAKGLNALGVLNEVDTSAFASYCVSYSVWRTAIEDLSAQGGGLVVVTKSGNYIQNPLLGIINVAARDMLKYASEFGLTPAARAKISLGIQQKKENKFDGLLYENK
jgi:P27 family predicted phage terminase small subunit